MTKTKGYIILAFIVITSLFIVCIFEIKDQYDKELTELRLNNKKLSYKLKIKKRDNKMMGYAIENLQAQVDGKKAVECDCSWYEDFYYEHMEEMGVME